MKKTWILFDNTFILKFYVAQYYKWKLIFDDYFSLSFYWKYQDWKMCEMLHDVWRIVRTIELFAVAVLVQPTNPESSLSVLCLLMYGSVMSYHCLNLFYMDMIHKKFLCFILPKNHCFVGCESCYSSIKFKGQLYTLLCHLSIWSKNKRFSCC